MTASGGKKHAEGRGDVSLLSLCILLATACLEKILKTETSCLIPSYEVGRPLGEEREASSPTL